MKKIFPLLFLFLAQSLVAQQAPAQTGNSLLWEISGNGLKAPSYLFGTYHLIYSTFIDSFPVIRQRFDQTEAMAGELVLDASVNAKLMAAAVMPDSSLDQLMTRDEYILVANSLREVSGMELALFNKMKPVMVSTLFYTCLISKKNTGSPMDMYFQELAKKTGRPVLGLETADDQVEVLFNSLSLKRQAAMLVQAAKDKDKNQAELMRTNRCYRMQDMDCIAASMTAEGDYTPAEMDELLYKRNEKWMAELPAWMAARPVFIAVGAGHLPGPRGLLMQLKEKGYTLQPVSLR